MGRTNIVIKVLHFCSCQNSIRAPSVQYSSWKRYGPVVVSNTGTQLSNVLAGHKIRSGGFPALGILEHKCWKTSCAGIGDLDSLRIYTCSHITHSSTGGFPALGLLEQNPLMRFSSAGKPPETVLKCWKTCCVLTGHNV